MKKKKNVRGACGGARKRDVVRVSTRSRDLIGFVLAGDGRVGLGMVYGVGYGVSGLGRVRVWGIECGVSPATVGDAIGSAYCMWCRARVVDAILRLMGWGSWVQDAGYVVWCWTAYGV